MPSNKEAIEERLEYIRLLEAVAGAAKDRRKCIGAMWIISELEVPDIDAYIKSVDRIDEATGKLNAALDALEKAKDGGSEKK